MAISGLDFTGVTSFGEIATILGTALLGVGTNDLNTSSVSYDVSRRAFVVRLGFAVSDGAPYEATGHFEDVPQGAAAALGLDQSSGGVIAAGYADETVEEAMGAIKSLDANWYFLTVDSRIDKETDLMALASWVQTQPHMLTLDVGGPAVLQRMRLPAWRRVCPHWSWKGPSSCGRCNRIIRPCPWLPASPVSTSTGPTP